MILTTAPDMTGTYLNYLWIALGIIAVFCALIWLGWRNRKRRQRDLEAPVEVPAQLIESEPEIAAEGMVIGTVKGEHYLDRVAVHELGLRTVGRVEVHWAEASADQPPPPHGIAIFRSGARNWFIPAQQLQYAGTDHGIVGKFVEKDGTIIIGWTLGETQVATGFRPRHAAEGKSLLQALSSRTPHTPPSTQPNTEPNSPPSEAETDSPSAQSPHL
ncbi:hypothetical protein [Garicola koreensis]|uniref:PH domain-containing protein n=1 Tax=Garicola koreensis TaxID=1262554 RepID=A0A7W5XK47_9MICC|nr:hypothetical protein [Garicola koreensis]MBB3667127.1 hypothetical protein [Garicola koreensis]